MTKDFHWSEAVASVIHALPDRSSSDFAAFLSGVESGSNVLGGEVLAFLIREALAAGNRTLLDRLFAVLWQRYAQYVLYYCRQYRQVIPSAISDEDITIEVFTLLFRRLDRATTITFYECVFLQGLKQLVIDKVRRLPDEPLVPLEVESDDEDGFSLEIADPAAVDPAAAAEYNERASAFSPELQAVLDEQSDRVRATAVLMMQGKSQEEIAHILGVSSRMVRNYKTKLVHALGAGVP